MPCVGSLGRIGHGWNVLRQHQAVDVEAVDEGDMWVARGMLDQPILLHVLTRVMNEQRSLCNSITQ